MDQILLKEFLDEKVSLYNRPEFIASDPIQIPHSFTKKEDIEIAGFLVATIAWGNRKSIVNSGKRLMDIMGHSPFDYVMEFSDKKAEKLPHFAHRTFNNVDLACFFMALKNIYQNHCGMEAVFAKNAQEKSLQFAIHRFKQVFFSHPHPSRSKKHISDPLKNSAAKRINMFLRWMVRQDAQGVDFGLWPTLSPSQLSCPLDVHSGNVARKLGLLARTQNDAKAVMELDIALRKLDPKDPVKYDFALFGLGVFEGF